MSCERDLRVPYNRVDDVCISFVGGRKMAAPRVEWTKSSEAELNGWMICATIQRERIEANSESSTLDKTCKAAQGHSVRMGRAEGQFSVHRRISTTSTARYSP